MCCVMKQKEKCLTGEGASSIVLLSGVSSGFGRAIALKLAADGHRVYGISRRVLDDPQLEHALAGYIRGDLCDPGTAQQAVEAVLAAHGRLDVLINDAGMGIGGSLEDTDDSQLHRLMELNFFAMARLCRCALPAMRQQGQGTILNISSLGGLVGLPFQGAYSASKYAVEGYSEALRSEVAPFGISVLLVEPGDFRTRFTSSRHVVGKGSPYEVYCQRALRRIEADETNGSHPDALAALVAHLVSYPGSRFRHTVGGLSQRFLIKSRILMGDRLFLRLLRWYYMGRF